MTSVKFFKKVMPIALAGAALVVTIPVRALAGDWNRHDPIAHQPWLARHQNWFNSWHHFRPARPAYVPAYGHAWRGVIPAAPAYGAAGLPGYAGVPAYANPYGAESVERADRANLTRLQNVDRHDRATGHPLAANDVARQMQVAGNRCGKRVR